MNNNIILGIILLIAGVLIVFHFIKHPVEDNYNASNTKGIIGGILTIIIAIMLLLGKVHW